MTLQWLLVAAILGIAGALPMQSHTKPEELMRLFHHKEVGRNSAIETLIINALEDFRKTMITGTDSIPVLDPLRVERVFVDDSVVPIPKTRVELNNLVVSQLSTYEVSEVSVEATNILLQRYRVQMRGEIPLIDVDVGQYDLFVPFMGAEIFGKGDAKITITKPWLKIDTNVNIRLGLLAMYLNIMDFRLDFGLDDIQFGIKGMFGIPMVDDFVIKFLRNLILEFAEFWVDDISNFISPIVVSVANDFLQDFNLIGLLT